MPLPRLIGDNEWNETTLPSGKKVKFRAWRMKEEKNLLFGLEQLSEEADGETRIYDEIIKFLSSCVEDPSIFAKISDIDLVTLVKEMRVKSKGQSVDVMYTCEGCDSPDLPSKIFVNESLKIVKFNSKPIEITEDLIINIKELSFLDVREIMKRNENSVIQYNYEYVTKSLASVIYNKETYDTFTDEEAHEFLDCLPREIYEKIVKSIVDNSGSAEIEKKEICPTCGHENVLKYTNLIDFFVF